MKKYAVAFPGQGSQYISMGKNMYMHNKIVRDLFDEASTILGYDLAKLCFEGEIEELSNRSGSTCDTCDKCIRISCFYEKYGSAAFLFARA